MASEPDAGWAARLNFRQLPDNPSDLDLQVHELNLRQLPGSGWTPIIDRLHRELIALEPEYELHQIKEKFGTLRFYGEYREDVREVCKALVRSAEIESSRTCERCGAPGSLRTERRWHLTLCARCHTFEPGGRPLPAEW